MECKIGDCQRKSFRRGFCRRHYQENLGKKCRIEGCNRYAETKKLCIRHYAKLKKYGDPLVVKEEQLHGLTVEERFNAYTGRKRQSGCIHWNGYIDPNGYGRLNINGVPVPAHRIAWELENGPIPDGLHVLHECDVPCCVNAKDHLFLGTQNDNNQDSIQKGRARSGVSLGENHGCSKLTEGEVLEIRASYLETGVSLAKRFNTSPTNISDIRKRKNWKHI